MLHANRFSHLSAVAALALVLTGPGYAQSNATAPDDAASPTAESGAAAADEGARKPAEGAEIPKSDIEAFTLDNGLQVIVLPDDRAPVVTQMIYYKVGAADETKGVSGIAHFLEHLMFKGTNTYPGDEFSQKVARIGGRENAFTSSDYTGYYQQVPSDALEMVMRMEADRMTNLQLTPEQVDPERDVILEERRMRIDNDPGSQLSEAVQATLYQNSPYGTPVIGWRSEMEDLTRDDAIEFYDEHYTPNNAILLLAGDVTVERARELAETIYGPIEQRAKTPTRERPAEPESLAARTVTLTDERVTQPSMQRSYVVPSETTATGNEALALDLLADILGGGTTSRLYRDLVVDKGIAAGVGAYYRGTALQDSQFGVYGTPRGGATLDEVEAAILAELDRLREDGVSEEELDRSKNRVRNNLIYLRDSQTAMAQRYATALATGQSLEQIESWPERIQDVTVEDVNAVARKYLQPQRSVTGYLLPEEGAASAGAADTQAAPPVPGPVDTVPPAAGGMPGDAS